MCGITGIYAFNQLGRLNMINLAGATATLESRGPDFQLTYHDEFVGLGHRRLSIIDPSPEGHQPMEDPTGRYVLIYNGEIYNFQHLKKQLTGLSFKSETDTEVLLHLLIKKGVKCLQELNGFFAFAFYDKQKGDLLMARDRYGIKPFHYFFDQDKLIFGSELKAVLKYGITRTINKEALHAYLQLNYIPAPYSILEGCQKLPPGCFITVKDRHVEVEKYHALAEVEEMSGTYDAQKGKFLDILEQSVQDRLIADVPLGTFLSGGLDSSAISALAARHKPDLHTFSIGYRDEKYFDESSFAELVADHIGSNHTVFHLTNRDLYDQVFQLLDYTDEPFADSSAIAVKILSRETRKHLTVALSGDGADELLGGYNKHEAMWRMMHPGLKEKVVANMGALWGILPKSRNSPMGNTFRKLDRFASNYSKGIPERYWNLASFLTPSNANHLLTPSFQVHNDLSERYTKGISEKFNSILDADLQLVLPNDMLTKVDLMSMSQSLEVRVPFLDHRLVDFVRQLPVEYKINGNSRKRILRDSMKGILPSKILHRSKKGFEVPLLKWFRTEMRSLIQEDLLHDDYIEQQGIFQLESVKQLKRKLFSSNPGDTHATVWALIVFQWWFRRYFEGN